MPSVIASIRFAPKGLAFTHLQGERHAGGAQQGIIVGLPRKGGRRAAPVSGVSWRTPSLNCPGGLPHSPCSAQCAGASAELLGLAARRGDHRLLVNPEERSVRQSPSTWKLTGCRSLVGRREKRGP
jgi:hypothetical protein